MTTYLVAEDVRKSYNDFVALKGVFLELYQGEILALLGPNGAGKTTLIKIFATLLQKDQGKVHIMGYNLDTQETEIKHTFGYVGQDTDRSAYARLTIMENLQFFGALRGLSKTQVNEQSHKLATYFNFQSDFNKPFMELSGGQKQTVVIIRALLHDPPIIYLDEPTKGLDPFIAKKIRTFLREYVDQEKKSILLTSHILSEVDELADRVALIHGGKISTVGTSDTLKLAVGATEFVELKRDGLPDATRDKILALNTVLFKTNRTSEWVSFGVNNFLDATEDIIKILREDNLTTSFRHHSVSLEDAFVYHVGALEEKFEQ